MGSSQYEFETHFEKSKLVALSESIKKDLNGTGATVTLWAIEPWRLAYTVATSRGDMSELLAVAYKRPEVFHVTMGVEPNTRQITINVHLTERWFVEEKEHGKASKRHPEAEGGSLA